jgi:two-component system, NarL family, sensor histidine kinase DevS
MKSRAAVPPISAALPEAIAPVAPGHDVDALIVAAAESRRRLDAFDAATVAISQELSIERVLQIIVDSVRPLVGARYAALGILDERGSLERFITRGISTEERHAIGQEPRGRGLLGFLIHEGESVRVPDIAADDRSVGFPEGHPPMTTFLGVPVRVEGRAIGRLYLTDKEGGAPFSEDDEHLVEGFARHAGLALHNARMHEDLRQLAVLKERERIAQDLHDGVIQSLYAVSLALEDTQRLVEAEPRHAEERIDHAIDSIHGTIGEIREFITALDRGSLSALGLAAGLDALRAEFEQRTNIRIVTSCPPDVELGADAVGQLVQLTREALSNVARHSGASSVDIDVEQHHGWLRLSITDDGRGFETGHAQESGHHGLTNMRARSEAIGGTLKIDSDEHGTCVVIELPPQPGGPYEESSP